MLFVHATAVPSLFETCGQGASQVMLMSRTSLPADAHDAHVLWGWGQGACQLMLTMRKCFENGPRGASQLMLMMRTCFEDGARSLPADAHDEHVFGKWGQSASQLMLMMRKSCGNGAREPPS